MRISIIVAVDLENGIGLGNQLLCHLPNDLKYFKQVTSGHCIIMGRKTFESIGKPLPNRVNIIVSRNPDYKQQGCIVVGSLADAIDYAKQAKETELMITGGGTIYKEAIGLVDRVYLTRIRHTFDADTFFPRIDEHVFSLTSQQQFEADEKHAYAYTFEIWDKR